MDFSRGATIRPFHPQNTVFSKVPLGAPAWSSNQNGNWFGGQTPFNVSAYTPPDTRFPSSPSRWMTGVAGVGGFAAMLSGCLPNATDCPTCIAETKEEVRNHDSFCSSGKDYPNLCSEESRNLIFKVNHYRCEASYTLKYGIPIGIAVAVGILGLVIAVGYVADRFSKKTSSSQPFPNLDFPDPCLILRYGYKPEDWRKLVGQLFFDRTRPWRARVEPTLKHYRISPEMLYSGGLGSDENFLGLQKNIQPITNDLQIPWAGGALRMVLLAMATGKTLDPRDIASCRDVFDRMMGLALQPSKPPYDSGFDHATVDLVHGFSRWAQTKIGFNEIASVLGLHRYYEATGRTDAAEVMGKALRGLFNKEYVDVTGKGATRRELRHNEKGFAQAVEAHEELLRGYEEAGAPENEFVSALHHLGIAEIVFNSPEPMDNSAVESALLHISRARLFFRRPEIAASGLLTAVHVISSRIDEIGAALERQWRAVEPNESKPLPVFRSDGKPRPKSKAGRRDRRASISPSSGAARPAFDMRLD